MRKQLGILASLLFLSISALFWTGCSNCCPDSCCEPCEKICEPRKRVCPPLCQPECCDESFNPGQEPYNSYNPGVEPWNSTYPSEYESVPQSFRSLNPPSWGSRQPGCRQCAPQRPVCRPPCPPPCQPQCAPQCQPPCQPPCPPQCEDPYASTIEESCAPPECAPNLPQCKYGPSGECSCNGVTVRARNPNMCILGDQYPLDLEITACCDVCEVLISTKLPEGVTYMRSQPEASYEEGILTWKFDNLSKGQTVPARIWLKCEREGDICACFCVKATPVAFCALLCAKPVLVCEKCGPEEVCPGDLMHYTVTVQNVGTCAAEQVVVTDNLPDGVDHASGQRSINFKLGTLEAGQAKKINFSATATKRGTVTNTVIASASNANQTSCEATTCICCCNVDCQKVGPKEVPVGQNADYQVRVTNTGDKTLHEVVVTDVAPAATSIVAAPGATISGKQAIWKLRELKTGETVSFNLTLTTCTPGYFTNRANVNTCEACSASCEFGTQWKGRPAYDICMESSENPICVGETTRFRVIVLNKGQEADSNVNVVVNFPAEIVPVNASGASAAKVNGQSVTFAPIPNLAPRQRLEYYVTVKANASGDLRPKVQVSSDFIKNPITEEESLIVN